MGRLMIERVRCAVGRVSGTPVAARSSEDSSREDRALRRAAFARLAARGDAEALDALCPTAPGLSRASAPRLGRGRVSVANADG